MSKRIHFGSLEKLEREQPQAHQDQQQGITLDQLNAAQSESSLRAQSQHETILKSLEKKKVQRNVPVPTDDFKVRQALRDLSQPVTYFGETNGDRRDRLKEMVAERLMEGEDLSYLFEEEQPIEEETNEEFFTYGPPELATCRRDILAYSIPNAIARKQQHEAELDIPFAKRKQERYEFYTNLQDYEAKSLQFGDDRPMGFCKFSPNSKLLATSSWSGPVKLWNVPESELVSTYKGHRDRVSGIDFHPGATLSQSSSALNFVRYIIPKTSGSSDGSVHLWALDKYNTV
jgi:U4/U6 small nuclear ribonucleoprotein PRP4